jgi:hypothetical protein
VGELYAGASVVGGTKTITPWHTRITRVYHANCERLIQLRQTISVRSAQSRLVNMMR